MYDVSYVNLINLKKNRLLFPIIIKQFYKFNNKLNQIY